MTDKFTKITIKTLKRQLNNEKCSKIKKRLKMMILAKKKFSLREIAKKSKVSKDTVRTYIERYKNEGLKGLYPKPKTGRPPFLKREDEASLVERVQQGPVDHDTVATFSIKYLRDILKIEYKTDYSISGTEKLLKRLNFSYGVPRPKHEKHDQKAIERWKEETLPSFIEEISKLHPTKKIELWFQDESRIGEKTRLKAVWRLKGTKVEAVKQTGYRSTYLFGAVNPVSGAFSGLVCGICNTEVMNIHLSQVSSEIANDAHVIMIMDRAGWHSNAKKLVVPANISILDLPAYSPELNPIERLWLWLKNKYLSNIVIGKDEDIDEYACAAWAKLTCSVIKSVCNKNYLKKLEPLLCL